MNIGSKNPTPLMPTARNIDGQDITGMRPGALADLRDRKRIECQLKAMRIDRPEGGWPACVAVPILDAQYEKAVTARNTMFATIAVGTVIGVTVLWALNR